ncbi:hypothetical protein RQP46_004628 [Phenoliferia psychrophenolica]
MTEAAEAHEDLTLGQLLARGIHSHALVLAADSPSLPATQKILVGALSDLTLSSSLISRLGLFSPNETVDDIQTRDLRCVLVDCLRGELEGLHKTTSGVERIHWIQRAREHFRTYIDLVDRYEIVPDDKRAVFAGPKHSTQDPTRRRESKIAQFKMERELKGKLEELRKRRTSRRPRSSAPPPPPPTTSPTPPEVPTDEGEDLYDSDDDESEVSRPLFLSLLQLHYLRAHAELASIEQELELLQSSMAMSDLPSGREREDVLRPFTILPSSSGSFNSSSPLSTRLRLQSEVFRSGHRLPTMTIDEYLEQEESAGRILQGGGPSSSEAVEQERRDQRADREDDTEAGYRKDDMEKDKAREWDEYTDTHRKGEGNITFGLCPIIESAISASARAQLSRNVLAASAARAFRFSVGVLAVVTAAAAAVHVAAAAPGLEQIDHVILYMQENRAFDHYFGTLAGVRGFKDPNVQVNADGRSTFYQQVNSSLTNVTDWLLPFHIPYQGEPGRKEATQCSYAGSNAWEQNQAALAAGLNDQWALGNSPHSVGYWKRDDIPVHYAIADGWTVADMYQEGVIAATDPNRVYWQSGSINVPGGNVKSDMGPALDNNDTPGCVAYPGGAEWSCYPYDWKTVPEYLEEAGVTWKFYQALDNWGDNPLPLFENYQELVAAGNYSNPLIVNVINIDEYTGEQLGGLRAFQKAAAAGTLPQYTRQIVEAVQNSPKYANTVLLISYDETGGLSDHVVPFHSPEGTAGEWLVNPYTGNTTFAGPGFRLPFLAISPFTRGSNVFTEPSDHTSQILFLEKWLAANGVDIKVEAINDWRREHMSDLVSMFNFEKPDYSKVQLPNGTTPHSTDGYYDGALYCEETYGDLVTATVPYGEQTEATALFQESGFKTVRGAITEGRYLAFEYEGYTFAYTSSVLRNKQTSVAVVAEKAASLHNKVIRFAGAAGTTLAYWGSKLSPVAKSNAETFTITDKGASAGYTLQASNGKYVSLEGGKLSLSSKSVSFELYSVTF